jgi:hypothetical protein
MAATLGAGHICAGQSRDGALRRGIIATIQPVAERACARNLRRIS